MERLARVSRLTALAARKARVRAECQQRYVCLCVDRSVRIIVCYLPSKSPWLNPIEPKWLHGKRAISEPEAVLTAREIQVRVCQHYHCELLEPIEQKVA